MCMCWNHLLRCTVNGVMDNEMSGEQIKEMVIEMVGEQIKEMDNEMVSEWLIEINNEMSCEQIRR